MLTNTIVAQLSGANQAEARGLVGRGAAPILALCRALVAAGHDPESPLRAFRRGTLAITIRTIAAGAALAVAEDRFGCPRFRAWKALLGGVAAAPIARTANSELHRASGLSAPASRSEVAPCLG